MIPSYKNKEARVKRFYYVSSKVLAILCLIVFCTALSGIFSRDWAIVFLCISVSLAIGCVIMLLESNGIESELYDRWDRLQTFKFKV